MDESFKCAVCGATLMPDPADDRRALVEAKKIFGVDESEIREPEFARVCNGCYRRVPQEEIKEMGRAYQRWRRRVN